MDTHGGGGGGGAGDDPPTPGRTAEEEPWAAPRRSSGDNGPSGFGGGDAAIEDALRNRMSSTRDSYNSKKAESGGALVDLSRRSWQGPNVDSLEDHRRNYLATQSSLASQVNEALQKTKTSVGGRGGAGALQVVADAPAGGAAGPRSLTSAADAVHRAGADGGDCDGASTDSDADVESGKLQTMHLARSSLHEFTQKAQAQERRNTFFGRADSHRRERRGTKLAPSGGSPMRSSIASSHNVMDVMGSFNKTRYRYKHQRSAKLETIINTTQRKLEEADDENISRAIEREHSEENTWYIDPDGTVNWVRQALVVSLAVFTAIWLPVFLVMGILERPAVLAINISIDGTGRAGPGRAPSPRRGTTGRLTRPIAASPATVAQWCSSSTCPCASSSRSARARTTTSSSPISA